MSDADRGSRGDDPTERVNDQTLDQAFDLLACRRRRYVIAKLRTLPDGVASVEDLADHLLVEDPDADDRERTLVALQHGTLPRLNEAGIVDFDRRTDTVRYRGNELVEELLTFVTDGNE